MDHLLKLDWARRHTEALQEEFRVFRESKPYLGSLKYNVEENCYICRAKNIVPFPVELSLIVGDIVHALRSALDALVYRLSVNGLGRMPGRGEIQFVQFPILDRSNQWAGERGRALKFLCPGAVEIIESFQPYNRVDPGKFDALSILRDLANIDKHRHILTGIAATSETVLKLEAPAMFPGTEVKGYVGPIMEGQVLAKWRFDDVPPPPQFDPKFDLKIDLALEIQISGGEGSTEVSAIPYLRGMVGFLAEEVFPQFDPFL